ncbi:glycogen/starch/alpha-glucan phosphorylase [Inquilinus limosus]|uniref:Alpha-1,4 glucan phosphorylase n=1 Tax=Inquilinus limosus MP06 TaxID=1398085 RepID=A0A0A0DD58_9PROT|nr:glycogen/starch/alpha-glucan phosphorylase [Inquilinus limosus]KGM34907.1 maltodextrin phosphorylase [Inquilinus limosus MP06]
MELPASPMAIEPRGLDRDSLKRDILEWLVYAVGREVHRATRHDWFAATALAVRDRLVDRWMAAQHREEATDGKRVYYLSLEFLVGRLMANALTNLGIYDACREALGEFGVDLGAVLEVEPDAALGNGGLGRLAACFLDSMATLGIAGTGYGIRYEYGLFEQQFDRGWQVEYPEDWLKFGNPWEFERPEVAYPIDFYGKVEPGEPGPDGRPKPVWRGSQRVLAVAYDTPVVGWGGVTVNTLRLWSAKPVREFDLVPFNSGDYLKSVEDKILSETLSRVLYPNDNTPAGQELRLKQEYFFTSASLQDVLRRHRMHHDGYDDLPEKVALQLNDTHPAIAVPELMRLLIDRHRLDWDRAWAITKGCISYTNHTLMPEALETWPVALLERVLPRHLQIVYEINDRFLKSSKVVAKDPGRLSTLSLIQEGWDRRVRMGPLAFLGSHRVNGVSALHTQLMRETVFRDLNEEFPDRITNKTNGITPRRWLVQANPNLSQLIHNMIGSGWEDNLERLSVLAGRTEDSAFREAFWAVKRRNKALLAHHIGEIADLRVSGDALFDVQVKRIHEYKRQLLNILHAVALWQEMRDQPDAAWTPRVKIFAGKAAPGYAIAKLIIKLANDVAKVINADAEIRDQLKMVFLPNYNVTLAERIIPAADLSEQISTAGMEASGTGNMKFALNGAITIGTLDGANVEIAERVGEDNILIFGLTAAEVAAKRAQGYDPGAVIAGDSRLARAVAAIEDGTFSPDDPGRFRPITDALRHSDWFLVAADFAAYWEAQARAAALYRDRAEWTRMAIRNTANVGWFSSDRTVQDYAEEIWGVWPPLARAAE